MLSFSDAGNSPTKSVNVSEEAADSDDSFLFENIDEPYMYKEESYEKYEGKASQEVKCPEIFHGDPVSDRRSTFQGHIAKVTEKQEVYANSRKKERKKERNCDTSNICILLALMSN